MLKDVIHYFETTVTPPEGADNGDGSSNWQTVQQKAVLFPVSCNIFKVLELPMLKT